MKLVHIICFATLLALASSLFSSMLFELKELDKRIEKLCKKTDSLVFISTSFCNCCQGKGFEDLDEWKQVCSSMWDLTDIEWTYSEKDDNGLFYGSWKGPYGSGEVYAKKQCDKEKGF